MKISPSSWAEFIGRVTRARRVDSQGLTNEMKRNLRASFNRLPPAKSLGQLGPIVETGELMDRAGIGSVDLYVEIVVDPRVSECGCGVIERALVRVLSIRWLAVRASMEFAARDGDFLQAIRVGDRERDVGNWERGEAAYRQALMLYPLHYGYRVQLAHMLKEQCRWQEAELNYREALALGAPGSDIIPHLEFSILQDGGIFDEHAISTIAEFWATTPMENDRWRYPPTYADLVNLGELIGRSGPMLSADILQILRGATSLAAAAERLAVRVADEGGEISTLLTSAMMMRAISESARPRGGAFAAADKEFT